MCLSIKKLNSQGLFYIPKEILSQIATRDLKIAMLPGHDLILLANPNMEPDELLDAVKELLRSDLIPETRKMVSKYSWESVISQLETYYEELLEG